MGEPGSSTYQQEEDLFAQQFGNQAVSSFEEESVSEEALFLEQ